MALLLYALDLHWPEFWSTGAFSDDQGIFGIGRIPLAKPFYELAETTLTLKPLLANTRASDASCHRLPSPRLHQGVASQLEGVRGVERGD